MPSYGICMLLDEATIGTEQGRADLTRNLQHVDAATRAVLSPVQYARLKPSDYTWTVSRDAVQKLLYVYICVQEPIAPAALPAKL